VKKNVMISLAGLQYMEEEAEAPIEVITFGNYFLKEGEHFVFYEEVSESGKNTKCRLKFDDSCFEMNKHDEARTKLVFVPGEEYLTSYPTPYGSIFVGILTQSLEVDETEDLIRAKIVYGLEINGAKTANCTLYVKIQSCEQ